jgi:hypothetical protein
MRTQGYTTVAGTAYARFFTPALKSNTQINVTKSQRLYRGIDELFVVRREDAREAVTVSIQPYSIKIYSLYPSIELGVEESKSNIPISSYRRTFVNVALKKNY